MGKLIQIVEDANRPLLNGERTSGKLTVCLITTLSLADFVDPELTAESARQIMPGNIGVLTLAALLRARGYKPTVVNLDQWFLDFRKKKEDQSTHNKSTHNISDSNAILRPPFGGAESTTNSGVGPIEFFPFVMERLRSLSFDVFGFSSICSSYPLTMRLAVDVNRLNPHSRIVLGGPQASVVDVATMRAFPCVDFVVRGEADRTFTALLDALSDGELSAVERIPGITFRREGEVIRNPNAPVIEDLDDLPLPAFDLDPDVKNRGSVYLEVGRGCPFVCTFCSTNDFFRRNFRLKSPEKMISEMRRIKNEYGVGNFSLIHDMYTVDRKRVVAFCEALLACGENFTWACSARTDCIDDQLISLMAEAGCRGIFFGIETGSQRLQTVINKKLDLTEARERILIADRNGIKTAVALIAAFPEETRDDLRDTIHFFVDSLRHDHAEPQLSLLAPLAATPIYEQHKDELELDHIFSDVSYQGWQQDPADIDLIKAYPDIFPNFYAVPTHHTERGYVKEVRDFVTYLGLRFRWLPVAVLQDSGDFLSVFDKWQVWLAAKGDRDSEPDSGMAPYHCRLQFRDDFLEFVRTCYVEEMATAKKAIAALAQTEAMAQAPTGGFVCADVDEADVFDQAYFPFQAENYSVMEIGVDYNGLVEALRSRSDLGRAPERNVTIVFRRRDDKRINVWQLAPLSAELIRLCNGKRTVEQIIQEFALVETDIQHASPEQVCLFGLMTLYEEGLIRVSRTPVSVEDVGLGERPTFARRYAPSPDMASTQRPWPWPSPDAAGSGA